MRSTTSILPVAALLLAAPASAQPPAGLRASVIDHVFLAARVEGRDATLLLDPIEGMMLDRRFVARHGIAAVDGVAAGFGGPVRAGGAGAAEYDVTFVRRPALRLGDRRVEVPLAPVIPIDSTMAPTLGRHVDGLVGFDALGDHVVELDYAAPAVRLHPRGRRAAPPGGVTVPVRLLAGKPIVNATIETADGRRLPAALVLDFGMGGTVRLTTRFTDAHGLVSSVGPTASNRSEAGLGGALESVMGRLARLSIGDLAVEGPVVSLARERTGGDAAPPYDGLVGNGVLRRYRVFVDWRGRTVTFVPTSRTRAPFVYAPTGVTFAPLVAAPGRTRLVVAAVVPGTPGAAAGLAAGDTVLRLDGRDAAAWTRRDWQDAVDASGGRALAVTVSRGGRRTALRLVVAPSLPPLAAVR